MEFFCAKNYLLQKFIPIMDMDLYNEEGNHHG